MPNCDRRWMPNHDRFECQTAIDSDAILQRSLQGLCAFFTAWLIRMNETIRRFNHDLQIQPLLAATYS
ncbi:hypothetical protein D9K12_23200 [Escherichia coli]|nr:hypothetical protein [Escherichia coli]